MKIKKRYYLYGILGILIILAFFSFIYQIINGLSITGLREPVVWGIYVVSFTFFFGLGAGMLLLLLFGSIRRVISDEFTLLSSLITFVFLGLTGAFIVLDLGRIDRFYYLVIHAQLKSPLVWDFVVMNILIVITVIFCLASLKQIFIKGGLREKASLFEKFLFAITTIKREHRINESLLKMSKFLVLFLVVVGYIITTEVFIGMKARLEWHTPLLSLIFLVSAILSGLSVMMLLKSFWDETMQISSQNTIFGSGSKFVLFLLLADIIFILIKYGLDRGNPLIQEVHTLFPFSFFIFLIIGNVLPVLLILIYKQKKIILYRLVPILILVGILLKRTEIIIPAYFRRWLPFAAEPSYAPTFPEISIVLGLYSVGIVAIILFSYFTRSVIVKKERSAV